MSNPIHKTRIVYPPEIRQQFVEWGRMGGKRGSRDDKARAGRIGAAKRFATVPRCPTCGRPFNRQFKIAGKTIQQISAEIKARQDKLAARRAAALNRYGPQCPTPPE